MSGKLTGRRLPSLNALRAFEAVGRRGRMTAAAEELFVSHGAVSRQVKLLEAALGVALLEGPKNRLRPTAAGEALLGALTPAFDLIETAVAQTGWSAEQLPVACHATPSSKWLIPRLPSFHAAHPEIGVELTELPSTDFTAPGVKAAVRLVAEPARGAFRTTRFMDNHVGPVLAPALAAGLGDDPAVLLGLPLIGSTSFLRGWSEWAERVGLPLDAAPVRRFARMQYMLEAAIAGLGVAIAPWALVAGDIEAGRLVAPFGFVPGDGWFAVITPAGRLDRATRLFVDWLVAEGARMPAPPTRLVQLRAVNERAQALGVVPCMQGTQDLSTSATTAIVVDDDPAVRATVADMLADDFAEVIEAGDAAEAFAALDGRPEVEVAVVDIRMPGLGGVEFAAMLADLHPAMAIVVMSGQTQPREGELPERVVFLKKPYRQHELMAAIETARLRRS